MIIYIYSYMYYCIICIYIEKVIPLLLNLILAVVACRPLSKVPKHCKTSKGWNNKLAAVRHSKSLM